ncbi:AAA family ATPase [Variovorax sp. VNK109]|uniref:AAA family ATPase n=1 Tax=Variovorax sp. VNK109 TaxID=3400919 RepID=UPI003C005E6E
MAKVFDQQIAGMGVAKITNVALALTAMKQIQSATSQMPRMAVLSGPPGLGKTQAAMYLAHPLGANAYFVQMRMFDTTKTMAQLILAELDVRFKTSWSVAQMFEATCERLMQTGDRPLVIDEVDHIAEKACIDYIRAIHDQCATPIFMIGEERLQQKLLSRHERFHDRVLTWVRAMPCDAEDAELLAKHYAPQLQWDAEVNQALIAATGGVARRITTEVERLKEAAKRAGTDKVTVAMVAKGARR